MGGESTKLYFSRTFKQCKFVISAASQVSETDSPLYNGHCGDQVNRESQSVESALGKSRLVFLMSYAR